VPVFAAVEDAVTALVATAVDPRSATVEPLPEPAAPVTAADYSAARAAFAQAGVRFVPAREIRSVVELHEAAQALRAPYVLKALGLLHKSDAGGVLVGLPTRGWSSGWHRRRSRSRRWPT
jgi:acyl-CoA synthetase (NDP forming)